MSNLFSLGKRDLVKGLVVAILTGAFLPIAAAIQTPGFSLSTVNWHIVWMLAMNGAVVGFASYIVKNFFSDEKGKFAGII